MDVNESQPNALVSLEAAEHGLLVADIPLPGDPALLGDDDEQSGQWLGTNTSTLSAIERLRTTIDEETEKLETRSPVDFSAFSQRKNRGLLELTRAMRLTQGAAGDPRVAPHLTGLRSSLIRNRTALQIHLDAVREVSAIIARSIQEVESDGTYSANGSSKPK
jgi:hypothetical protein